MVRFYGEEEILAGALLYCNAWLNSVNGWYATNTRGNRK